MKKGKKPACRQCGRTLGNWLNYCLALGEQLKAPAAVRKREGKTGRQPAND